MVGQFVAAGSKKADPFPRLLVGDIEQILVVVLLTSQHHHAYQCPQFHTFSFSQSLTHLLDKTRTVFLGLPVLGLQGIFNCI